MSNAAPAHPGLDWVQIKKQVDKRAFWVGWIKARDILISNPVVPIGFLGTCACLIAGIRQKVKGNSEKQNVWMRRRITFHSVTFLFAMAGICMQRRDQGVPIFFAPKKTETIQTASAVAKIAEK